MLTFHIYVKQPDKKQPAKPHLTLQDLASSWSRPHPIPNAKAPCLKPKKTQWSCDHGFNSWPGTLNRWISEVNRAPSSNNTAMITFIRPILKSLSLLFTWKHFIQLTIAHVYTYIYIFIYKPHCSHVCKYIYIHVTYKYVCSHIYIYIYIKYAYMHTHTLSWKSRHFVLQSPYT